MASASGGVIGWEIDGRGPDLILLHGSLTDRSCWEPLLPHLRDRHRVLSLDRRGRGLSVSVPPADDIATEVEDLARVIAALGSPPHVCAWSFGAVVALEAAMTGVPMSRLILYEPPLAPDEGAPARIHERFSAFVSAGDPDGAAALFLLDGLGLPRVVVHALRQGPGWPAVIRQVHTTGQELAALEAYRCDPARLRGCRVPTLVLSGTLSAAPLKLAARRLAADLRDARLTMLEGHHHVAFRVDPVLFASIVSDFLASFGTGQARTSSRERGRRESAP